jgi:hypothetical protein
MPQKLRQLGDIHRNPARLIFDEQFAADLRPGSSSKLHRRAFARCGQHDKESRRPILRQTTAAGSGEATSSRRVDQARSAAR